MSIPHIHGGARRYAVATLSALVAGSTLAVAAASPASALTPRVTAYGGNAYGTSINLGVVHSGQSAFVPMCTTSSKRNKDDKTAAVDLGSVGTIGAVTTNVHSSRPHGWPTATATSTTAATSLLGGLISFTALRATVTMSRVGGSYRHTASLDVVNLRVAGIAVNPRVQNQTLSVPGLASVEVNKQPSWVLGGTHGAAIVALKITLFGNTALNIPGGTIFIGRAQASLHDATYALPIGYAYGSTLSLGSVVSSGRTAPVYLPCGGSGTTVRNDTAGVDLPGLLHTDAVSSWGYSRDPRNHTSTTASLRNHVAGVNLGSGAVTVKAVSANATATRKNGRLYRSTAGTGVVGLRIGGRAVNVLNKPNTRINVAGLGTLWINRVVRDGYGVHAYGLQLVLSVALGGHAKGSTLTVAGAYAGVQRG